MKDSQACFEPSAFPSGFLGGGEVGQLWPVEITEGTPKAASRKGRARKSVQCHPVTWPLSLSLPICRVGGAGEH